MTYNYPIKVWSWKHFKKIWPEITEAELSFWVSIAMRNFIDATKMFDRVNVIAISSQFGLCGHPTIRKRCHEMIRKMGYEICITYYSGMVKVYGIMPAEYAFHSLICKPDEWNNVNTPGNFTESISIC